MESPSLVVNTVWFCMQLC
uniref:Uncharacterized protein n=1 Tax=Rhizophora mucronata TaxID=61149 RepID=A0A2P2PYY6_RHIMU